MNDNISELDLGVLVNIFENPNGFKFYFDWASRSYYGYEKGGSTVPLQSVTRVIYDIFPEFDKDGEILTNPRNPTRLVAEQTTVIFSGWVVHSVRFSYCTINVNMI